METIVIGSNLGESHFIAKSGRRVLRPEKKLRRPPDSRRREDSVNCARRFLCGFGPAGEKTVERAAQACLAWHGCGESGRSAGIIVAKKQSPVFLLCLEPAPERTDLH
ncbi:hypothetical protein J2Y63_005774 [Shinella sp. BE166]|uniref:hypothetical protein n=1 Tax=Shinella sp. BE166 TaxID=3373918 RepID=UPI003EB6E8B2